jgi:circadian clock protein KaiB
MDARVVRLYANEEDLSDERTRKGMFLLKLYVSNDNPHTESTIENLRRKLDRVLDGNYGLTVHNVVEEPQLAEDEKILATPTLVKEYPLPTRRIIGDFSAIERICMYFELPLKPASEWEEPD